MKLYTKPGACSTADHIALHWTGGPFEVEVLDGKSLKGPEYLAINPAGAVPAVVDGDFVLTQNAAIMGYIADSFPDAGLMGDGSPRQRAQAARSPRCSPRESSWATRRTTTRCAMQHASG